MSERGAERANPVAPRWVGVALLAGALVTLVPVAVAVPLPFLLLAPVVGGLVAVAYTRPAWAAYLLLVATPLTAGIARGQYVPLLRPHEALAVTLGSGVALRALVQLHSGHPLSLRLHRFDVAVLAMAVASSLLPMLWMVARGLRPNHDDIQYALTLWKYYGLFVLVRASVRTEGQVKRCLQLSIAAYAGVAVLTILQSLQLFGVPHLIDRIYFDAALPPGAGRGTGTLDSSIAIGDVMAISLAICLTWLLLARGPRRPLVALALLFAFGGLASGQVSGLIALAVAVLAVAIVTGRVRKLLVWTVPTTVVAAVVMWPVVTARLEHIDFSTGLPQSWVVRLFNLRLFVWPQVFSGLNWLFGVRPSARILADVSWGPYIYIESGHTWLLWTGGVPFFLAYLYFTWVGVRTMASTARVRPDVVGVAAGSAVAGLLVVFVLMALDAHLTMRGVADLLFSLLALASTGRATRPAADIPAPVSFAAPRPREGDRHAARHPRIGPTAPFPPAVADPGRAEPARR